jgi:transcriptional regulator with XRE-family HTH domain
MASFGDFIKQEREKKSWTQTDFGAKLGINSSAISRIEHGVKQLSATKLPVIAKLFDVDIAKIKELYFGDKFAKEVYKYDCPETVFVVAEEAVKYLKTKNTKQTKITFD